MSVFSNFNEGSLIFKYRIYINQFQILDELTFSDRDVFESEAIFSLIFISFLLQKTVETVKPVQHSRDNVNTYLSIMISAAYPNLKKTIHSSKELRNGLCRAHININGLYNKLDEIRLLLQESKFDLLAITETHLSEEIHKNTELCIDQYSFVRKDRTGKSNHWGGVLVYYLNFIEIEEIDMNTDIESIWINVILRSQKLLLGCIYRPPNDKKFLPSFKTVCLLYTSPSPRDKRQSRMPSSA